MNKKSVKLRIYGMTCDDCAVTIGRELKKQEGILKADISFSERTGYVEIDEEKLNPEQILKNRVFSKTYPYRAIIMEE